MDWTTGLIVAGVIALLALAGYGTIQESEKWEQFKATHACKVVGRTKGDLVTTVAPVIGGNGGVVIGVSGTPDKTGWLCDDDVTYWR